MSLNKKTWHYITLSTKFKIQMNWHLFNILIGLLVFAVLTSTFGGSSSFSASEYGEADIDYVSSDLAFVFVLIWAFVVGWTLARPAFREMDFSFVSNRFTSHMSSILYIGFASVIGGLIGFFSIFLGKALYFLFYSTDSVIIAQPYTIKEIFIGAIVTISLAFLLATVGYFVGELVNWNQAFIFILPALIIGNIVLDTKIEGTLGIGQLVMIFSMETEWWVLFLKVLGFSILIYTIVMLFTRRMEVRT
ncbi:MULTISPECIES: hypothetical protein [Allobacillus]|uniref:ABC transporter permease n=1 Tax=Allobacillus salarius TaxID=1955272 RepID=A0A556PKS5_9BACI|nr:hypothetical protein [Allobacillus salarius]TSJ64991.1 hypothetical protein FPQ13_08570 [Allobacillus salarius]